MHFRALPIVLLAFPLLTQAAPRTCLVVGISDGDTLTARCGRIGAYERVKVRIAAIDAPEKAQPYGQRSRQALSNICFREQALITEIDTDRYGRTVADVSCNGEDAGSRMVRAERKDGNWIVATQDGSEFRAPSQSMRESQRPSG